MSLHLIAEDNTPDEPTVAAPSVCPTCEGEGVVLAPDDVSEFCLPCPDCCCSSCWEPTDTPPLCRTCDIAQDAAYERRQDR